MARTTVAYIRASETLDVTSLPAELELIATVRSAGVAPALERIAADEAEALFLVRLGDAARSLGELVRLLDWLEAAGTHLIAADVRLDTGTASGRRVVSLLREIHRWGRERDRPRGRPGLGAGAPAVAERVAELRRRGLSLAAIASQLNDEGVPTPRGGAMWRASSVQAALGYRRPRPPIPGAPPPPGPKGEPGVKPPAPDEPGIKPPAPDEPDIKPPAPDKPPPRGPRHRRPRP